MDHFEVVPDMQVAQAFLEALDPNGRFTFQTFDDNKERRNPRLCKILHGSLDNHVDELIRLNRSGAAICVAVNETDLQGRTAENILRVRAVFLDLDGAPREPLRNLRLNPHLIVGTSEGRFHAYWLVDGLPLDRFAPVQQAIATHFGGDPNVTDLPRALRLPGCYHCKCSPIKTVFRVVTACPPRYGAQDILSAFPVRETDHPAAQERSYEPSREGKIKTAERNDRLISIAGSLRRQGLGGQAIEAVLQTVNQTHCEEQLSDGEVASIAKSIVRYPPTQPNVSQSLNDVGNAVRFVAHCGQNVRYCHEFKKWLYWDGARWLYDNQGQVVELAKATAKAIYREAAGVNDRDLAAKLAQHAQRTLHEARLHAMVDLARSVDPIPISQSALDANPWRLGARNGVIDLETGRLHEPRREDYITRQAWVDYDGSAQCPAWLAFLDRIMNGNEGMVRFLQRAVGYTLTGQTREQCLFFLYGSGANGKSTLLNVVKELLGDYATQCAAETLMVKYAGGGANNDIARLRGARLVASSEVEDGSRLAENMVKQMTGQDALTARFLYGEYFDFVPTFKLWIAGNHKPVIRGDDNAIWRRMMLIPFTVAIPPEEQDPILPDKLRAELSGILSWALEGCLAWQKHGLGPPAEVKQAVEQYRDEMDVINHWIEACCVNDPKTRTSPDELYRSYKAWAEGNGFRPLSSTKFGMKMRERGYQDGRNGKRRFYVGIRLGGIENALGQPA